MPREGIGAWRRYCKGARSPKRSAIPFERQGRRWVGQAVVSHLTPGAGCARWGTEGVVLIHSRRVVAPLQ